LTITVTVQHFSCPWVRFLQPNPAHREVKTLDPQTNPTHNP